MVLNWRNRALVVLGGRGSKNIIFFDHYRYCVLWCVSFGDDGDGDNGLVTPLDNAVSINVTIAGLMKRCAVGRSTSCAVTCDHWRGLWAATVGALICIRSCLFYITEGLGAILDNSSGMTVGTDCRRSGWGDPVDFLVFLLVVVR